MIYFVYKIGVHGQLTPIESCEDYRSARRIVRDLRAQQTVGSTDMYRMIFAAHQQQAEQLLLEKREAKPMGELD